MHLTPREIEILTAVVEDYIASAQPVGSRAVSKRGGQRLCAASIRGVMADLTDRGYLEQPHTSAGRVPTPRAFRFYLDTIMQPRPLAAGQKRLIASRIGSAGLDMDDVLRQASRVLAALCRQVSMVMAPARDQGRLRQVDFVLIKPGLVMAVLVLQGGLVVERLVEDARGLSQDELTAFGNYLNDLFRDLTLSQARERILTELHAAGRELSELCRRALVLAGTVLQAGGGREMFVGGRDTILSQPEFSDLAAMRRLLAVLEERDKLLTLLDRTMEQAHRPVVRLGSETSLGMPGECSLVATAYGPMESPLGVIALIGPMRMDYAQVLPVVDYTAELLSGTLARRF